MARHLKIVIIGAGTMGSYLAQLLEAQKFEVVVVDTNTNRLSRIQDQMDVQTLKGEGVDPYIQVKAGVRDAELLLALTNDDEVNLMSAFIAKRLGARTTVARARSPWYSSSRYLSLESSLGVDKIMNPEHLSALEIVRYLDEPDALQLAQFAHGKVQLRTFTMDEDSPFVDHALSEIRLPENVLVVVRTRGNVVVIPTGDTVLRPGDKITIMGVAEKLPQAQKLFHARTERVKNVTVAGGGVLGEHLVATLEQRGFHVKLVEKNLERARELSERLTKTQIIHGNATDRGFMEEERLQTSDVFVAVTGDDEDNLMACLLAKELGIDQTVVKLARPDYASLVQQVGISLALSPRHVMAERILTLISRGRIKAMTLLENGQVEVIETVAGHGSPLVGRPLSKLTLPKGALISTIVHLGETIVPRGQHEIQPGDTVIAIGFKEAVDELEAELAGV